jgi:hypothetical protein
MKLGFNGMAKKRDIVIEEPWFAMPPKSTTGALESENNVDLFSIIGALFMMRSF